MWECCSGYLNGPLPVANHGWRPPSDLVAGSQQFIIPRSLSQVPLPIKEAVKHSFDVAVSMLQPAEGNRQVYI